MTEPDYPVHGGDLTFATARYGESPEGWLDLSTGVNPHAYPASSNLITGAALHRLPDGAALAVLQEAARAAYGAPPGVAVAAVPGSEIAIRLLPLLMPGDVPAFIVSPTYDSHRAAWPLAAPVASIDEIPDDAIAILANPNNPDGRLLSRASLLALAQRVRLLVVDEAFGDITPDANLLPAAPLNAVVLRSVGKFYGLAGLRLGFVFGPKETVARLSGTLGAWPISGPAIAIGTAALGDVAWRTAMRTRLAAEADALTSLLATHGLRVVGRTDLFVLTENARATDVHAALARRGVWTRAFPDRPTWLRFGLPGDGFTRLERALRHL